MTRISTLALTAGAALWLAGCQSTGNIGYPGAAVPDSAIEAAALHMPVGEQVMPPYGYIAFCLREPANCEGGTDKPAAFALTPARWAELNEVNNYVNRAVTQVEDRDNRGVAEYWDLPNAGGGDCEDLALLKRKMLIERGWPAEALLMTVAREWNGDGHAVLTATTDKGDYVLDNKNWAIVAWSDAPYTWVKRQSPKRPYVWVSLDRSTTRVAAEEPLPPLGAPIPFLAGRVGAQSTTGGSAAGRVGAQPTTGGSAAGRVGAQPTTGGSAAGRVGAQPTTGGSAPSATALRPTLDGDEGTATPIAKPQGGPSQTPIAAL